MKRLKRVLMFAALAGAMTVATTATAAPVTQLIHFDDAGNGDKWYSDADLNFLFDPTNLQSSSLCADSTNGGNGSCVIEGTQGVLPRMTRPEFGPQSQGSPNAAPIVSGTNQLFTLDSFYFLLTGNGEGAENAITAAGSNGASYTFQLGGTYAGNPNVTFYEGANAGDPAGALAKQIGYIATFGDLFANVSWIQFSAPTTAQIRLDCVVATFDGTTTQPANGACGLGKTDDDGSADDDGSGDDGPGTAPEPAAMALLGVGLVGVAYRIRRN